MKYGSDGGFTLVELMIAGAILSILILAFSSYVAYQHIEQKKIQIRSNYMGLENSVKSAATQPRAVQASLEVVDP